MPIRQPRLSSVLLSTGQTTQYASELDDGYYEKGVVKSYTILTTGQYSGTTNITINSKTDTKSNNCVLDNNTGLMWSRYVSASVGVASNGLLEWTTTGSGATAQGIFPYVAAANAASLAGYTDWRVANIYELISITDYEAATSLPNSTAFPSFPAGSVWSSTTQTSSTTSANFMNFVNGAGNVNAKTVALYCLLVRG